MQSSATVGCGIVRPRGFALFAGQLALPRGGQGGGSVPISQFACIFDP